jgi:hypothetical protein
MNQSVKIKMMSNLLQTVPLRKFIAFMMVLTLGVTTVACSDVSSSISEQQQTANAKVQQTRPVQTSVADGQYDVQQATYNDGDGEYTLFLLNTPPGTPATYRTNSLQMAQLTPEETEAGKSAYLKVNGEQASFHIPKDFKIEYIHNVVEAAENPQTGQVETRIVRQESNFWTPFAGALAGQVIGNLLFTPRYYVPPVYQPGLALSGYGGYGNSYRQAIDSYQQRYQAPPAAVRNRTVYRSTGRRTTGLGSNPASRRTPNTSSRQRSTGRGVGSSNLRPSNSSSSYRRPSSSFGSGRSSFGSGRSSSFGRSSGRRR